ncbi:MAG: tryptophan--tRNA ligase [Deltaproteobacteria bacterium]|nr:tryptophan--tRNA ligase [Deltaproteobacteria bacterium]
MDRMNPSKIVVSGMRPTGKLHLGHYFGVLKNWLELQNQYRCFFFIADWHALTTEYQDPKILRQACRDILLDWLAAGLDPKRCTIFLQSRVPEHAELHLLLSMLTPISWLERVPSYKELKNELKDRDLSTYGFLGYPLLQTADVAIYNAHLVPVGQDQVAHLELSREVLRRFNHLYGETFVEPQPLLTPSPKVPGLDGRKMSKSYGNAIYLSDDEAAVRKKMGDAVTDPARIRKSDPGNPDICNVFDYHRLFSPPELVSRVNLQCRAAEIGCVEDKKLATENLLAFLRPIQERRRALEADPKRLEEILEAGAAEARKIAQGHLKRVYERMGLC